MASTLPPFSPQQVEQVARIIGGTDDGLTGPEIGGMLGHLGFPDEGAAQTKWKRLYNSLAHLQNKHNAGNHTVQLINAVMRPEGYVTRRDLFKSRQPTEGGRLFSVSRAPARQAGRWPRHE